MIRDFISRAEVFRRLGFVGNVQTPIYRKFDAIVEEFGIGFEEKRWGAGTARYFKEADVEAKLMDIGQKLSELYTLQTRFCYPLGRDRPEGGGVI